MGKELHVFEKNANLEGKTIIFSRNENGGFMENYKKAHLLIGMLLTTTNRCVLFAI